MKKDLNEVLLSKKVWGIHSDDRVYLSKLNGLVRPLKKYIDSIGATMTRSYENATVVVLDEVVVHNELFRYSDTLDSLWVEHIMKASNLKKGKDNTGLILDVTNLLRRDNLKFVLMIDLYPKYLNSINAEELEKLTYKLTGMDKSLVATILSQYDPYCLDILPKVKSRKSIYRHHARIKKSLGGAAVLVRTPDTVLASDRIDIEICKRGTYWLIDMIDILDLDYKKFVEETGRYTSFKKEILKREDILWSHYLKL